jgi:hypothetical protein
VGLRIKFVAGFLFYLTVMGRYEIIDENFTYRFNLFVGSGWVQHSTYYLLDKVEGSVCHDTYMGPASQHKDTADLTSGLTYWSNTFTSPRKHSGGILHDHFSGGIV